ncbi:pentatricopeptide repeat-containing protein At4g02750 [Cryptomeria japonica]|uniref:pentatricopeptide repeat-containing protein At4g02750 n=1 Tax=Cryptomeria japonica TaxID=3369 RepID=UPI0025ACA604|nr:pentatricopeptide repeat-containing protein At4g02750 [Cryptomeria japonica]
MTAERKRKAKQINSMTLSYPLRIQKKNHCIVEFMVQFQFAKFSFSSTVLTLQQQTVNDNFETSNGICEQSQTLCRQGLPKESLHILHVNDHKQLRLSTHTYESLLRQCLYKESLREGKRVHAHMTLTGFISNLHLAIKLVVLYAKLGSLQDARLVLDKMPVKNVAPWTAMIQGYSKDGNDGEALAIFCEMQGNGFQPDNFTFAAVLPVCANLTAIEEGKQVHEDIVRRGLQFDVFVGSALVDMYAKCGCIEMARKVFDKMPQRNVVSWTTMVAGYTQIGDVGKAMELFQKMPERNVYSWNVMVTGYAHAGCFEEALELFKKIPNRKVVSWNAINAIIGAFAQFGKFDEALKLFQEMQLGNVKHKHVTTTYVTVLPVCASLAAMDEGKQLHADIIRRGFQSDKYVGTALVDMYVKCGCILNARKVFDKMLQRDVVLWTVMVAGYAQTGDVRQAMKLFEIMPGKNVYSWTVMVTAYAQAGCMDKALNFFKKTPNRNVVSWNAMIAGYVQNRKFHKALKLFQKMQLRNVRANLVTFTSVLPACANLAALRKGIEIHGSLVRSRLPFNIFVWTALVGMYANCGRIRDARKLFDKMIMRNVVSWNVMIVGYAMHGHGKEALQIFQEMQNSGTKPNNATFVGVLCACRHAGLVDYGKHYFRCMIQDYNLVPTIEHYSCMVDLLGKAGYMDEARDFINTIPVEPDTGIWESLLDASRIHAYAELGEHVSKGLFGV